MVVNGNVFLFELLILFGLFWFGLFVVVILGVLLDRTGFGLVWFGLVGLVGLFVVVILGQYTDLL